MCDSVCVCVCVSVWIFTCVCVCFFFVSYYSVCACLSLGFENYFHFPLTWAVPVFRLCVFQLRDSENLAWAGEFCCNYFLFIILLFFFFFCYSLQLLCFFLIRFCGGAIAIKCSSICSLFFFFIFCLLLLFDAVTHPIVFHVCSLCFLCISFF